MSCAGCKAEFEGGNQCVGCLEQDETDETLIDPIRLGVDGCTDKMPFNIGRLNWMKRFKCLGSIVQWLAVRKMTRVLKAEGVKYTKEKLLNGSVKITLNLEG